MELNLTTFILELLNFFILVWLLKRFLYKPVLGAIESRREGIEEVLRQTKENKENAEQLYEQRKTSIALWEQEKQTAEQALSQAIAIERDKRLAALQLSMQQEEEKRQTLTQHKLTEQGKALEKKAIKLSLHMTSQLLSRFAGPELEQLIIARTLEDLQHLTEEKQARLKSALKGNGQLMHIRSACALAETQKQSLEAVLQRISMMDTINFKYTTEKDIVAGIHITIDSLQINASLQSELAFFQDTINGH